MESTFIDAKYVVIKSDEGNMSMLCAKDTVEDARQALEQDYDKELGKLGMDRKMAAEKDSGGLVNDWAWLYERENLDWKIFRVEV